MTNRIKRAALALAAALMLTACSGGNSAVSGAGSSASSAEGTESAPVESAGQTTGEASGTADAGADITVEVPQDETAAATTEDEEMSEEVKYIALTFDDGPNATTTNEVIDKLEKYGIVASFFLVGNNVNDESAKAVKRAYDLGCEIDNHSRTHSNMTELSAEEIKAEFDYTDEKVYEITGEHTKFFRPPYIAVHQIMFDNIDVPFIAGIGANDWEDRVTAEMRARMILKQAKDGDIILLHDAEGNSMTVEALDTIIPELQKQGYKFVTVTELFSAKGIIPDMEKVYTNVTQKYQYN
ncbi:polysaccharide deacetylase [Eubacterium sp. CAG:786]|nr:polysaccharide deacetylase [Eubacterium sp. CAG:786]